jgi:hypothetical protein
VERGEGHLRPTDDDRLEDGERRGLARPTDRHHDAVEAGGPLLGRELEGDGPAGRLGGRAELPTLRQLVDLDDGPVDLVVELVAVGGPVRAVGVHGIEIGHETDVGVDREAGGADPLEGLAVAGEGRSAFDVAELVRPEAELARRGDGGVLLAERPGGGVARVDEGPGTGLGLTPVELVEGRDGHVDLAPYLDGAWVGRRQTVGHHPDRAHVGRHVLTDDPVAARRRPHEAAILVEEAHGQPVDLELAGVVDLAGDVAVHPLAPGEELLVARRLVERHHGDAVADLGKQLRHTTADPLRRRVGRDEIGVGGLEGDQLRPQRVEFGVAQLRIVLDEVSLGVVLDLRPQLPGPHGGCRRRAFQSAVPPPSTRSPR